LHIGQQLAMATFIYQRGKEEVKSVHTPLTNGVNLLSSKEARIVETCWRTLGTEFLEKVEQIVRNAVEKGRGDPVKTITSVRSLLTKLRVQV
jgi:hypothetical protein